MTTEWTPQVPASADTDDMDQWWEEGATTEWTAQESSVPATTWTQQ